MDWKSNAYVKLAFFAFCLVFFFFLFRFLIFREANRYTYIGKGAILDTATGAVYSIRTGKNVFNP